jgi:hypothetical protein
MTTVLRVFGCWWGLLALAAAVLPDALILGVRGPFLCRAGMGAWHCPFCGLTRSFVAVGNGDIDGAMRHHPLGVVVYGIFVGAGVVSAWSLFSGPRRGRSVD